MANKSRGDLKLIFTAKGVVLAKGPVNTTKITKPQVARRTRRFSNMSKTEPTTDCQIDKLFMVPKVILQNIDFKNGKNNNKSTTTTDSTSDKHATVSVESKEYRLMPSSKQETNDTVNMERTDSSAAAGIEDIVVLKIKREDTDDESLGTRESNGTKSDGGSSSMFVEYLSSQPKTIKSNAKFSKLRLTTKEMKREHVPDACTEESVPTRSKTNTTSRSQKMYGRNNRAAKTSSPDGKNKNVISKYLKNADSTTSNVTNERTGTTSDAEIIDALDSDEDVALKFMKNGQPEQPIRTRRSSSVRQTLANVNQTNESHIKSNLRSRKDDVKCGEFYRSIMPNLRRLEEALNIEITSKLRF